MELVLVISENSFKGEKDQCEREVYTEYYRNKFMGKNNEETSLFKELMEYVYHPTRVNYEEILKE